MITPLLVGKPVVVASSYQAGRTEWDASVVFFVRNPSSELVGNVQYRVTLFSASGQRLSVSSGEDTFGLDKRETRPIVFEADGISPRPRSAKVKIYAAETGGSFLSVRWQFTDSAIVCDPIVVQCDVVADLTLRSRVPARVFTATALVRRKTTGAIVAAGVTDPDRGLKPNQTIPVKVP